MSTAFRVAREELRQWRRSRLAIVALCLFAALLFVTSALTANAMLEQGHERLHQQEESEQTFLSQPARHPHRMVHYGHYVFRTPPPLSMFDPGVDAVTGQSLFLEGHRQNAVMFANASAQARTGGFGALTPASLYYFILPLLLIALGHSTMLREHETRTLGPLLAQGTQGFTLLAGKLLAMLALVFALSLPVLAVCVIAVVMSEPLLTSGLLYLNTVLYLLVWSALAVLVSTTVIDRGVALGVLIFLWLTIALILPRVGVAIATAASPVDGKITSDMKMNDALSKAGDGHNTADPAFAQLRANLLAQYDVETVEELPINFRGAVALKSESDLTAILNDYAEKRMQTEINQSRTLASLGWISPYIAASINSRQLSGTDLATHHRFLREAENLRFDFVQGLNQAHKEVLSYDLDINRNANKAAFDKTRIDPENWQVLNNFRFEPDDAATRSKRSSLGIVVLVMWLILLLGANFYYARRLSP